MNNLWLSSGRAGRYFALALWLVCMIAFFSVGQGKPLDVDLMRAKSLANNIANLIYQRFELHNLQQLQLLLLNLNIPVSGWDILKFKIGKKIIASRDRRGKAPPPVFSMVFGGSAVTAGYNNYFNQTYPSIVERRLGNVFSSLGIQLVVKNLAQGHVDCRLNNYCFTSMMGASARGGEEDGEEGNEVDVVGWENSFDCGGHSADAHEFIARIAAKLHAVMYYSTSGAFAIDGCPPAQEAVPWISEEWKPIPPEVNTSVVFDLASVREFKELHQSWFEAGSSIAKFTRSFGDYYKSVGAHGFGSWTKTTKKCQAINSKSTTTSSSTTSSSSSSSRRIDNSKNRRHGHRQNKRELAARVPKKKKRIRSYTRAGAAALGIHSHNSEFIEEGGTDGSSLSGASTTSTGTGTIGSGYRDTDRTIGSPHTRTSGSGGGGGGGGGGNSFIYGSSNSKAGSIRHATSNLKYRQAQRSKSKNKNSNKDNNRNNHDVAALTTLLAAAKSQGLTKKQLEEVMRTSGYYANAAAAANISTQGRADTLSLSGSSNVDTGAHLKPNKVMRQYERSQTRTSSSSGSSGNIDADSSSSSSGGGGGGGGGGIINEMNTDRSHHLDAGGGNAWVDCQVQRLKGKCAAEGGPRWRVAEASEYGVKDLNPKKWYPTIGMHLFRAEIMVFSYVHIILDAIYMVEDDLKTMSAAKAMKKYRSELYQLQVQPEDIPETPRRCDKEGNSATCALAGGPQCFTDYQPNYNARFTLEAILVGDHIGWFKHESETNPLRRELQLLDEQFYYKSEGGNNELHLQLKNVQTGQVRLYARNSKESLDEALFFLDPNTNVAALVKKGELESTHSYIPSKRRIPLTPSNYSILKETVFLNNIAPGSHVLTIMTNPQNPTVITSLTHLLVF